MQNKTSQSKTLPLFGYLGRALIVFVSSGIIIYLVKNTTHIHTPYFAAVVAAMLIGYVEPKMGWALAIAQCATMAIGYYLIAGASEEGSAQLELEVFALVGSMLLTFVASFLGAFMKRAINS